MVSLARENSFKYGIHPTEEEEAVEDDEEDDMEAQTGFSHHRSPSDASEQASPYHDDDDSRPETPGVGPLETATDVRREIIELTPDNVTTVSRPAIMPIQSPNHSQAVLNTLQDAYAESNSGVTESLLGSSNASRRSSSFMGSNASSYGLSNLINTAYRKGNSGKNAFIATAEAVYHGLTYKNISKGFFWSLAITSMHYVGIAGLRIPGGYYTLNPYLFILSGLISWVVCLVGCILMAQMETHLSQQFLFSFVATAGVAAMHFTGKEYGLFFSQRLTAIYRHGSCDILVTLTVF